MGVTRIVAIFPPINLSSIDVNHYCKWILKHDGADNYLLANALFSCFSAVNVFLIFVQYTLVQDLANTTNCS